MFGLDKKDMKVFIEQNNSIIRWEDVKESNDEDNAKSGEMVVDCKAIMGFQSFLLFSTYNSNQMREIQIHA
ncbi:unnamed protein product [Dovyalis caffra]|uniref:Uncharacterized protein n=1 Tax=Dovyalis caffra TaxID=77055 RepID=A0AAV1SQK4_9ROSI|nr:unnamed protein product [Dovyalis caffra]